MKIRKPKNIPEKDIEELTQQSNTLNKELPKPEPLPDYDQKFKPIHNYIVDVDPEIEWPIIKEWIEKKSITLTEAVERLAEQPNIAMRANRLSLLAKKEYERFTLDFKERSGILRDFAIEYWEERKRNGMHKQITNEMIEDWIVENYGSVWTEMKMRLRDMKNASKLLEQLSDQVMNSPSNLKKEIDQLSNKIASPSWFDTRKKGNK